MSLLNQNFFPENLEIVVSDNDRDKSAEKTVLEFSHIFPQRVHYSMVSEPNIALNRNNCLDIASGSTIIFLDDDQFVPPTFFKDLSLAWERTTPDIWGGRFTIKFVGDEPKDPIFWEAINNVVAISKATTSSDSGRNIAGGGSILRSDRFRESKIRFRENVGVSGGEDTLFFCEAEILGAKYIFFKEIQIYEMVPKYRSTYWYQLRRAYHFGNLYPNIVRLAYGRRTLLKAYFTYPASTLIALLLLLGSLFHRLQRLRYSVFLARQIGKLVGLVLPPKNVYKPQRQNRW